MNEKQEYKLDEEWMNASLGTPNQAPEENDSNYEQARADDQIEFRDKENE